MLLYLLLIAFQVWAVLDCLRHHPGSLWVLAVLLLGPFGALAYVFNEMLQGRRFGVPMPTVAAPRDANVGRLEAMIATNPAPALFVELADVHARLGNLPAAAEAYGCALQCDPTDLYARYHLGRALADQGRHAEAADHLRQVHAVDAKYDYGAAAEALADALLATGQEGAAFERYAELAGSSSRSRPKFQYAWLLDRQGRRTEAVDVMREIVSQADSIPDYLRAAELPWIKRAQQFLAQTEGAAAPG